MDKKQVERIREKMRPEDGVIASLYNAIDEKENKRKFITLPKVVIAMSVAVCCFLGTKYFFDSQKGLVSDEIALVTGLSPYETLQRFIELETNRNDKIESDITGFFRDGVSVVLVKVDEVINHTNDSGESTYQSIKATVLFQLRGETIQSPLSFTNYLIGNTTSVWNEHTQEVPMREGGVYVLPLEKVDDSEFYHIGTHDYLFEVDDKGMVNSQSRYRGVVIYDGISISDFVKALNKLQADEMYTNNLEISKILESATILKVENYEPIPLNPDDERESYFVYKAIVSESFGTDITGEVFVYSDNGDPNTLSDYVLKEHDFSGYYRSVSVQKIKSLTDNTGKSDEEFIKIVYEISKVIRDKNLFLQSVRNQ